MDAQFAQAMHSAATFEAALRASTGLTSTPNYGLPVSLLANPVAMTNHAISNGSSSPMTGGGRQRASQSTPPSPQSGLQLNGSTNQWSDRSLDMATKGRLPADVFGGLPLMQYLAAAGTPVRGGESAVASTVLKNKGDVGNGPGSVSSPATARQVASPSGGGRSRAETFNGVVPHKATTMTIESQRPEDNGMTPTHSMPAALRHADSAPTSDRPHLEPALDIDVSDPFEPMTPAELAPVGLEDQQAQEQQQQQQQEEEDEQQQPIFVFPSVRHNDEDVKAAIEQQRERRADLQRASSSTGSSSESKSVGTDFTKKQPVPDEDHTNGEGAHHTPVDLPTRPRTPAVAQEVV